MTLAARIVAEAAGGDLAAAGCRVAVAQLRDDLDNPDLTATQRRRRFDQVTAATKTLLARTPKENHMTRKTPVCVDQSCPMAWAEHDAHDGRPSHTPTGIVCADPNCGMAWVEHEEHQKTIEGEVA